VPVIAGQGVWASTTCRRPPASFSSTTRSLSFLLVLPSALLVMYVFQAPAWVVFACLKNDEVLKCFVAVVKINRFKWMKNLTRARVGEAGAELAEV